MKIKEKKDYNFKLLATVLSEEMISKILIKDAMEFKIATQYLKHKVGKTIKQRNGTKEKIFALAKSRFIFWRTQKKYLNFKEEIKEEFGELTEKDKKDILKLIKRNTTHQVNACFEEGKLKISKENKYGLNYRILVAKEKEHLKNNF